MTSTRHLLAPHMRLLLSALDNASSCASLNANSWDCLVRTARSARLLGVLAARIGQAGLTGEIPEAVANHLGAAEAESRYLRQMTLRQLAAVAELLRPVGTRLLALKGSAYVLRDSTCAAGRMPRDVDIMVEQSRLNEIEQALLAAGWEYEKTDPYDQHYYRAWSHELPPMRAPAMPLELDVHHTILPPLGRLRADAQALFAAAVPVAGTDWWTLCPADLVLHAAVHLYQDSEWIGRLRDLVDIDGLVREAAATDPRFWKVLGTRAQRLRLGGPLWYVLTLANDWLGTPVALAPGELDALQPREPGRALVLALSRRCLAVGDPEGESGWRDRFAYAAMSLRANWMRMPPHLLLYHATRKFLRSLRRERGQTLDT